jgi:hypothetical protein
MTGKLIIYCHRLYGQRVSEQEKRAGRDFIIAGRDGVACRPLHRMMLLFLQRAGRARIIA